MPAIEGVTACQAASAAVRERPSGSRGPAVAVPGVSHAGNVDLAVRPVSVATDVDLLFGPAATGCQPMGGTRNEPGVCDCGGPPPFRGASLRYGADAPPVAWEHMTVSILAGPGGECPVARRLPGQARHAGPAGSYSNLLRQPVIRAGQKVTCGCRRIPGVTVNVSALEEQRSEKYRHALIAVVSIGVRAGQLGGTDAWLSSHLVSHA